MAEKPIIDISQKVLKYEEFLNERLRPDLKKALDEDDRLCSDIASLLQLRLFLTQVKEKSFGNEDRSLKVMTDLGCNMYVQADIEDTSTVSVYLGLGVYLDMPIDEAMVFLEKRRQILESKKQSVGDRVSLINAHIKLVLEGLRELQNISDTKGKQWSPPDAFL